MSDHDIGQQGAETAGAPSKTYTTHGRNMSVADLIRHARNQAKAAGHSRIKSDDQLHEALVSTLEIFSRYDAGEAQDEFEALGIKIDGRTKNPLTPWIKLIFVSDKPSNINRNAAALKFALDHKISPNGLSDFLKKQRGVAKCAALEAAARRAAGAKRISKAAKEFELELARRREIAPIIELPAEIETGSGEFISVLMVREPKGGYRQLGSVAEDDKSIRRFFLRPATNPRGNDRQLF